jgi:hypothetical protein
MVHASNPYNYTIIFERTNETGSGGFYDTWFIFDTGRRERRRERNITESIRLIVMF